jgi:uncharacterized phiE125 gp8 family phage protein
MKINDICEEVLTEGSEADEWTEPVSIEDMANQLNLNTVQEENLRVYISSSRFEFEERTGRVTISKTFRQHLRCWRDVVRLMRSKVSEVVSVTYFDADDEEQELPPYYDGEETNLNGWLADLSAVVGLVYCPSGSFPSVSTLRLRPICIEFVAGWETAEQVPAAIKDAIRILAAEKYLTRENAVDRLRPEIQYGFANACARWHTGVI